MPTRFAAGVAMIAAALLVLWLGGWWLRALAFLAAVLMFAEWTAIKSAPRVWAMAAMPLFGLLLFGAAEYLYPAGDVDTVEEGGELVVAILQERIDIAWQGLAAAAAMGALIAVLSRRVALGWGFLYIAAPAFALVVLSWLDIGLVLWVMAVTWATDIFAYFAGRAIGGPKLAPRISPNKTWAGLIGGMAGAAALGWLIASWLELGPLFALLGAPMGLVAQIGDLYESWEKRRAGVKDSGTLLPGHGGVLDRLDGLLAVAIATLAILMTGLWTG